MILFPETCFKTVRGTLLDVILTNKPNCFQKTSAFETSLSDFHKLVVTIFRSTFKKLPPKIIKYRSYKNFNEKNFVYELDQQLIQGDVYKTENSFSKLTEILSETLNKHAPMKSKTVRGNQAPFMNKVISKNIMNKSRIKNKWYSYKSLKICFKCHRFSFMQYNR